MPFGKQSSSCSNNSKLMVHHTSVQKSGKLSSSVEKGGGGGGTKRRKMETAAAAQVVESSKDVKRSRDVGTSRPNEKLYQSHQSSKCSVRCGQKDVEEVSSKNRKKAVVGDRKPVSQGRRTSHENVPVELRECVSPSKKTVVKKSTKSKKTFSKLPTGSSAKKVVPKTEKKPKPKKKTMDKGKKKVVPKGSSKVGAGGGKAKRKKGFCPRLRRMASLNAQAKVHVLYEKDIKSPGYTEDSGDTSRDDCDTSSWSSSSDSDHQVKVTTTTTTSSVKRKKKVKKVVKRKRSLSDVSEVNVVTSKRMANLNAQAILAATYSLETSRKERQTKISVSVESTAAVVVATSTTSVTVSCCRPPSNKAPAASGDIVMGPRTSKVVKCGGDAVKVVGSNKPLPKLVQVDAATLHKCSAIKGSSLLSLKHLDKRLSAEVPVAPLCKTDDGVTPPLQEVVKVLDKPAVKRDVEAETKLLEGLYLDDSIDEKVDIKTEDKIEDTAEVTITGMYINPVTNTSQSFCISRIHTYKQATSTQSYSPSIASPEDMRQMRSSMAFQQPSVGASGSARPCTNSSSSGVLHGGGGHMTAASAATASAPVPPPPLHPPPLPPPCPPQVHLHSGNSGPPAGGNTGGMYQYPSAAAQTCGGGVPLVDLSRHYGSAFTVPHYGHPNTMAPYAHGYYQPVGPMLHDPCLIHKPVPFHPGQHPFGDATRCQPFRADQRHAHQTVTYPPTGPGPGGQRPRPVFAGGGVATSDKSASSGGRPAVDKRQSSGRNVTGSSPPSAPKLYFGDGCQSCAAAAAAAAAVVAAGQRYARPPGSAAASAPSPPSRAPAIFQPVRQVTAAAAATSLRYAFPVKAELELLDLAAEDDDNDDDVDEVFAASRAPSIGAAAKTPKNGRPRNKSSPPSADVAAQPRTKMTVVLEDLFRRTNHWSSSSSAGHQQRSIKVFHAAEPTNGLLTRSKTLELSRSIRTRSHDAKSGIRDVTNERNLCDDVLRTTRSISSRLSSSSSSLSSSSSCGRQDRHLSTVTSPRCPRLSPFFRGGIQRPLPRKVPRYSNGWVWEGASFKKAVYLRNDDPPVVQRCYSAMRHVQGDVIRVRDCILLKSGPRRMDLPFVAKVAALWENPDDGEMMISVLWYYRPEHTEQGRRPNHMDDEIFASKHRDVNSVACIEDKCHVLTFNEYCRYQCRIRLLEEGFRLNRSVVPELDEGYPRKERQPPGRLSSELVFFCRKVYDFRQKRILKNPS